MLQNIHHISKNISAKYSQIIQNISTKYPWIHTRISMDNYPQIIQIYIQIISNGYFGYYPVYPWIIFG